MKCWTTLLETRVCENVFFCFGSFLPRIDCFPDEPTIGYFLVTFRSRIVLLNTLFSCFWLVKTNRFFISPRELLLRLIRKCKNNSVPAAASPEIASQWEEWLAPLRQKCCVLHVLHHCVF